MFMAQASSEAYSFITIRMILKSITSSNSLSLCKATWANPVKSRFERFRLHFPLATLEPKTQNPNLKTETLNPNNPKP